MLLAEEGNGCGCGGDGDEGGGAQSSSSSSDEPSLSIDSILAPPLLPHPPPGAGDADVVVDGPAAARYDGGRYAALSAEVVRRAFDAAAYAFLRGVMRCGNDGRGMGYVVAGGGGGGGRAPLLDDPPPLVAAMGPRRKKARSTGQGCARSDVRRRGGRRGRRWRQEKEEEEEDDHDDDGGGGDGRRRFQRRRGRWQCHVHRRGHGVRSRDRRGGTTESSRSGHSRTSVGVGIVVDGETIDRGM